MKSSLVNELFLIITVISLLTPPIITPVQAQPPPICPPSITEIPSCDFTWTPYILVTGSTINFTASASGGTAPYTFAWNFSDGTTGTGISIGHVYPTAGNHTVTLIITDSSAPSQTFTIVHSVPLFYQWPIARDNWVVRWNFTSNDGIKIWDVTYRGALVIRDARLPGVLVKYVAPPCIFYDEHVFTRASDEDLAYQNSTDPSNPWFQINAVYEVGGYDYTQFWRFYPSGRWDLGITIGHSGCATDHVYNVDFRIDLSIITDQNNYASMLTPDRYWQDLMWEGNYTDNGFRDSAHNSTVWRIGGYGKYYYIAPSISQTAKDMAFIPSDIILVRSRPNEIEVTHNPNTETPLEWANGELAFRRNIAIWWVPRVSTHGPFETGPPDVATLSFYPVGL